MIRTLARRATTQHIRQPAIRFPDRKAPKEPHAPHPHPAAPQEIASQFTHFQEVLSSGPHFDASKLQPFHLARDAPLGTGEQGSPGASSGKRDDSPATGSGAGDATVGVGVGGAQKGDGGQSQAGAGKSGNASAREGVAEDLHELPERFWKTPTMMLDDVEMEAVMTGGASLVQR